MVDHRRNLRRYEIYRGARFLTFSCYNRLPLFGNGQIRDHFVESIVKGREVYQFELLAWVIMPEHVHLLLVPEIEHASVDKLLWGMKRPFARKILNRWRQIEWSGLGRLNDSAGASHFWQIGGGFDRNVRDQEELRNVIQYVHNNPVSRGLVDGACAWRWSSANWYETGRGMIEIDRV